MVKERSLYNSSLRLMGDTHIALHDTIADKMLKVDMSALNDRINQRYNIENDVSVMEAAEEAHGEAKFVSDRCKLSIKNNSIEKLLLNGVKIPSIESLQISGLESLFGNTCLEKRGPYVTTEIIRQGIDSTMNILKKYTNLSINLLQCNKLDGHLIKARSKKNLSKDPPQKWKMMN
ncbi:unnamed protein product [Mucor hiemalis]